MIGCEYGPTYLHRRGRVGNTRTAVVHPYTLQNDYIRGKHGSWVEKLSSRR